MKLILPIILVMLTFLFAAVVEAGTGLRTVTGARARNMNSGGRGGNFVSDKPAWYGPMMQAHLQRSYGLSTYSVPGYAGFGYSGRMSSSGGADYNYGGGGGTIAGWSGVSYTNERPLSAYVPAYSDYNGPPESGPRMYYNPYVKQKTK